MVVPRKYPCLIGTSTIDHPAMGVLPMETPICKYLNMRGILQQAVFDHG